MISLELRVWEKADYEFDWNYRTPTSILSRMSPTVSQSYSYLNHKNEASTFIIISSKWHILCHLKLTLTASMTKKLLGIAWLIVFWSGEASGQATCILCVCIIHVNTIMHVLGENAKNRPRLSSWWRTSTTASTPRAGKREKRKVWKCWELDLRGQVHRHHRRGPSAWLGSAWEWPGLACSFYEALLFQEPSPELGSCHQQWQQSEECGSHFCWPCWPWYMLQPYSSTAPF